MSTPLELFLRKFSGSFQQQELVKLQLTAKRDRNSDLKRIMIAPVEIKKQLQLNFVYRYETKDITKNYFPEEAYNQLEMELRDHFLNAELLTVDELINFYILPNGKFRTTTKTVEQSSAPVFTHDKLKERKIDQYHVYQKELGLVNASGDIRREMSDKFKQINQYIELLSPYLLRMDAGKTCHIVDMGSGKGYLTFALYDYLANKLKHKVQITGVEYRQDMVDLCNSISAKSGFEQLNFIQGTIDSVDLQEIDVLIALHACNTATDDAIFRGLKANSSLIVCAPCCHKQVRKEMEVPDNLNGVLKHGILKERQAELLTDGLRAMILESQGYKTQVFEFVSLEHTPKNVMIVAEKNEVQKRRGGDQIWEEIQAIKTTFGIKNHYLEQLLKSESL